MHVACGGAESAAGSEGTRLRRAPPRPATAELSSIARVICSVVRGRSRTRTPTASATALPIAPATGPWASSPAPVSGSPGAATIRTATSGTSVNRRIG